MILWLILGQQQLLFPRMTKDDKTQESATKIETRGGNVKG